MAQEIEEKKANRDRYYSTKMTEQWEYEKLKVRAKDAQSVERTMTNAIANS